MEKNYIDFLTPESGELENKETVINNENNGHINTDPKVEINKPDPEPTPGLDFINTSTDGAENNVETPSVDNKQATQEPDYYDTFMDLAKNGYIDIEDLPEDVNQEEGTATSAEDVLKALLHNMPKREEAILKYGQSSLINRLPKEIQEAISYAEDKGDPIEYMKTILGSHDITSLNPENEIDQVSIVREFYKTTDLSSEEINEKIEELKDTGLIAKEASRLKPKLDKRAEDIAQKKLLDQAQIKANKDAVTKIATTRVVDNLLKGVNGIKFSREEAEDMLSALMEEKEWNYGTHSATKTGIEYLIDYHKYSTNGDPNKIIKALMILDPQNRYEEKIASLYKKEIKESFVNEHMMNSGNKFKQPDNKTTLPKSAKPDKKEKFKFIKY